MGKEDVDRDEMRTGTGTGSVSHTDAKRRDPVDSSEQTLLRSPLEIEM